MLDEPVVNFTQSVEYDPGEGKRQNVHTKRCSKEDESDKIEAGKVFSNARLKTAKMPLEEIARAVEEWQKHTEIDIPQSEKKYVYEELDNDLTVEEKERAIVNRSIGNYYYTVINKGHNQYKIIQKELIEGGSGDITID